MIYTCLMEVRTSELLSFKIQSHHPSDSTIYTYTNISPSLISLSYSKNGVIRANGFSVSEQTDEEAVTVWTGSSDDEEDKKKRKIDLETSKSVLALIGDKFCQLIKTEDTAITWVKKDSMFVWNDRYTKSLIPCHFVFFTLACCLLSLSLSPAQIMWKRAVRGVREMCDACEATLFNMHWACHKCGFVVCMDCYKAREKRKPKGQLQMHHRFSY